CFSYRSRLPWTNFLLFPNFAANLLNRRVGAWGETTKIAQQAAYPSVFSLFLSLFLLPLWKIFPPSFPTPLALPSPILPAPFPAPTPTSLPAPAARLPRPAPALPGAKVARLPAAPAVPLPRLPAPLAAPLPTSSPPL